MKIKIEFTNHQLVLIVFALCEEIAFRTAMIAEREMNIAGKQDSGRAAKCLNVLGTIKDALLRSKDVPIDGIWVIMFVDDINIIIESINGCIVLQGF